MVAHTRNFLCKCPRQSTDHPPPHPPFLSPFLSPFQANNSSTMNQATLQAARKKKQEEARVRHERRMEVGKAAMKRRWSDPVAPARRPLGNVDSNRRQSEPPPPLASAAAVKASERKQTQHFTYDSMPKHLGYRRKRQHPPLPLYLSPLPLSFPSLFLSFPFLLPFLSSSSPSFLPFPPASFLLFSFPGVTRLLEPFVHQTFS